MFGCERNELIGQDLEQLIPERFKEKHAKLRDDCTYNPTSRSMESAIALYAVKKDGIEFPVEISLSHFKKE